MLYEMSRKELSMANYISDTDLDVIKGVHDGLSYRMIARRIHRRAPRTVQLKILQLVKDGFLVRKKSPKHNENPYMTTTKGDRVLRDANLVRLDHS